VRENTTASKKRPTPRENKAERQTSKCKNTICGLYVPRSYGILQEAPGAPKMDGTITESCSHGTRARQRFKAEIEWEACIGTTELVRSHFVLSRESFWQPSKSPCTSMAVFHQLEPFLRRGSLPFLA
ncbi:MAG TPA: hypothetical protein VHX20_04340, partial [Terracidiphilus sp.]|nr:hypothetical protein [Terracidiphilus sp.]